MTCRRTSPPITELDGGWAEKFSVYEKSHRPVSPDGGLVKARYEERSAIDAGAAAVVPAAGRLGVAGRLVTERRAIDGLARGVAGAVAIGAVDGEVAVVVDAVAARAGLARGRGAAVGGTGADRLAGVAGAITAKAGGAAVERTGEAILGVLAKQVAAAGRATRAGRRLGAAIATRGASRRGAADRTATAEAAAEAIRRIARLLAVAVRRAGDAILTVGGFAQTVAAGEARGR